MGPSHDLLYSYYINRKSIYTLEECKLEVKKFYG